MTLDEFKTHCLPVLIAAFPNEIDEEFFNFIKKSPDYFVSEINDVPQFIQKTLFKNISLSAKHSLDDTYEYIRFYWDYEHPGGSTNGYTFAYMIKRHNSNNWKIQWN